MTQSIRTDFTDELDVSSSDITTMAQSIQQFGFGHISDAIVPKLREKMIVEADAMRFYARGSSDKHVLVHDTVRSNLGSIAKRFMLGEALAQLVCQVFGERYCLSTSNSCLTYYQAGSHLGYHLDQPAEECLMTVIVYLDATSPNPVAPDTGLALHVYSNVKENSPTPRVSITTEVGKIVMGFGSKVWHARPMLKTGEQVTAITACFRHA